MSQPPARGFRWSAIAAILLSGHAVPGLAGPVSCRSALGVPAAGPEYLKTVGRTAVETRIGVVAGHDYLLQVDEQGNDVLVEVVDSKGRVVNRADHPERRSGTQRALVTATDPSITVRVSGKEHAGATGTATLAVFDLAVLRDRADCLMAIKAIAQGDSAYAEAGEATTGHAAPGSDARPAFQRASQAYLSAEQALRESGGDEALRGETELALAGLEYLNLQDWHQAADWATVAKKTLAPVDPYRAARADALLAAAWIEIDSTKSAGVAAKDSGNEEGRTLNQARDLLRHLVAFHLKRNERYDAGLQQMTIGLSYLNEGRFQECIEASAQASRILGSISEWPRRAVAEQNRALCLWGLGRLPEAARSLQSALADIDPEASPSMYVGAATNAALAEYATGHFDESLRLYDRALVYAEKTHRPRDVAYCLYGIGVNYYALGDRQRARDFLERSLAIRTVAVDGRGRMSSLRALANIDAEQGKVQQALDKDREALDLAIAPTTIARIRIQQARHTAAAEEPEVAMEHVNEVLTSEAIKNPLIKSEALFERAVLLRVKGRPAEALRDLQAATPGLRIYGTVVEEFEAHVELARTLRDLQRPQDSLAAVDRALGLADAVRLQTANPELRTQLQTPLRPAYDLKLELLHQRYESALAGGRDQEAKAIAARGYAVADAARAHSFLDVAAQHYSAAVRRELDAEFQRRDDLYRELASRRATLNIRLERSGPDDPSVKQLLGDIAELRREVDTVNTSIAKRTTVSDTRGNGIQGRTPIPDVGIDRALVSYWLGSEAAYAWVVLRGEVHWALLGSPAAIATQALAFHRSLTRLVDVPAEPRLREGADLYDLVVGPIEPLLTHVHDWVIVPDGALNYVPFAALRAGAGVQRSFVISGHDVAVTPAGWMLNQAHGHEATKTGTRILIVADPVYQADDPRLAATKTRTSGRTSYGAVSEYSQRDFRRLPFTAVEAAEIAAQFPAGDVDELLGLQAARDRVLALDWAQFKFIHIGSHGVADAMVPSLSALILGSYDLHGAVGDREIRVADIALKTLTAEVVVLSGCETALGAEVRSEGLMGINSMMLARGAHAVVASLWSVPDKISAEMMTDFYAHMVREGLSPQAALSAAMRSASARERSSDPALWAAFQVSVATLGADISTAVVAR